jgi:hypothetical protein
MIWMDATRCSGVRLLPLPKPNERSDVVQSDNAISPLHLGSTRVIAAAFARCHSLPQLNESNDLLETDIAFSLSTSGRRNTFHSRSPAAAAGTK